MNTIADLIYSISPVETPFLNKPIRYKASKQKFSSMKARRRNQMKLKVKKIKVWKRHEWVTLPSAPIDQTKLIPKGAIQIYESGW